MRYGPGRGLPVEIEQINLGDPASVVWNSGEQDMVISFVMTELPDRADGEGTARTHEFLDVGTKGPAVITGRPAQFPPKDSTYHLQNPVDLLDNENLGTVVGAVQEFQVRF